MFVHDFAIMGCKVSIKGRKVGGNLYPFEMGGPNYECASL